MNLNFDFSETSDFWLFRIFGIDLQVPEVDRRLMSPVREFRDSRDGDSESRLTRWVPNLVQIVTIGRYYR